MTSHATAFGPVELTRLLLGALLALALVAPMLPVDAAWGIQWLGFAPLGTQLGDGDGRLWVPLFEINSPFEKFTMFSLAHFVAVANEVALLAGPAAIVCLAWLTLGGAGARLARREVVFLASCVAMTLAYIFFFNPDMAVLNVGILNE